MANTHSKVEGRKKARGARSSRGGNVVATSGEAIGRAEMFLMNAFLLQRFKFEKCSKDQVLDFTSVPGITWHPKPFSVRVSKRI